jgi:hypothetical protein
MNYGTALGSPKIRGDGKQGPLVGPVGNSYAYQIDGVRSAELYANAQSAWYDARRPQIVTDNGLTPSPASNPTYQAALLNGAIKTHQALTRIEQR